MLHQKSMSLCVLLSRPLPQNQNEVLSCTSFVQLYKQTGPLSCWSSLDWHRRSEARSPCQLLVRHLNKYPHFGNSLTSNGNYVSPLRGSCFSKPEGWTASPVTDTTKDPLPSVHPMWLLSDGSSGCQPRFSSSIKY